MFGSLFENIGKKIKYMAELSLICTPALFLFVGMAIAFANEDEYPSYEWFLLIIPGILIGLATALLIYGFGELIDKACQIEKNTRKIDSTTDKSTKTSHNPFSEKKPSSFDSGILMDIPPRNNEDNGNDN